MSELTKYSFDEMYFKILPEGRIRRRQYIARMIGGGILLGITYKAITFLVTGITNPMTEWLGILILTIAGLFLWYNLNIKRIRDIGKNPTIVKNITLGLIAWNFISSLYNILGAQGWIPRYVGAMQQALDYINKAMDPAYISATQYPWHQLLVQYINYPYSIVAIGLFLYLFLMPGKKGNNEYGKDPLETKLGLLG